jgi:hypothetical protein
MVEDAISLAAALNTIWAPIAQRTRCGAGHSPAEAQLNVESPNPLAPVIATGRYRVLTRGRARLQGCISIVEPAHWYICGITAPFAQ